MSVGERDEKFLDWAAKPTLIHTGTNFRVFWHAVPHSVEGADDEGRDWSNSEPDPKAPQEDPLWHPWGKQVWDEEFRGGCPLEHSSRPVVDAAGDVVELADGEAGEICAFGEVLPKESVRVFVRAALPG